MNNTRIKNKIVQFSRKKCKKLKKSRRKQFSIGTAAILNETPRLGFLFGDLLFTHTISMTGLHRVVKLRNKIFLVLMLVLLFC